MHRNGHYFPVFKKYFGYISILGTSTNISSKATLRRLKNFSFRIQNCQIVAYFLSVVFYVVNCCIFYNALTRNQTLIKMLYYKKISSAVYGRTNTNTCPAPGLMSNVNCKLDQTAQIAAL